ncbi:MAG: RDD family protein [Schleiferiaceae bacterium]|nr:RDD family protein [Schleiferiaceae bacterium]
MNKIEIQTPQNVTIELNLADGSSRALAFFIDQIFLTIVLVLSLMTAAAFDVFEGEKEVLRYVFITILLSIYFFYSLLFEIFLNGRTPGKIMLGLRVRKLTGNAPELLDYLIRWIFRIPDLAASAGLLAFFLVTTSKRKQRLGDLLANTIVINEGKTHRTGLQEILKIKDTESTEINFPQVAFLTEDSILTLKDLVLRNKYYTSSKYTSLINETADTIGQLLGVEVPKHSKENFLRQVVREYVILTR